MVVCGLEGSFCPVVYPFFTYVCNVRIIFCTDLPFADDSFVEETEPFEMKSNSQSELLECYKHLLVTESTVPIDGDIGLQVSEIKPTYRQFQNFQTFINTLEKQGLHRPGMVKVCAVRRQKGIVFLIYI